MSSHPPRNPCAALFLNGAPTRALGRIAFLAASLLSADIVAAQPETIAPASGSPRPRLVYAGDAYFPPFEYKDAKGQARGFNIEVVTLAANEAGYDIEFRLGAWSEAVARLHDGRADLAAVAYSGERAERYDLLSPIWNMHMSLLFPGGRAEYPKGLEDLSGERVALIERGLLHETLLKLPPDRQPKFRLCADQFEAVQKLLAGEATMVAGNGLTLRHVAAQFGLVDLVEVIRDKGIRSIAIPPLGSGLGGLDWNDVRPRIERALADLADVQVLVFEPKGAPANDKMVNAREVPKMTEGRAALVELMQRYLGGLLDPFVSLLEVHKLMYFMQEAGEPLRLNYVKHHYGPYAENLRHVLKAVEGHLIAGYADGGDAPEKPLTLVPGAVEDAKDYLDQHEISRARFDRVSRLVEGFESPFGMELLATVHWVMSREGATELGIVERQVYGWNARKRQFTPRQLAIAEDRLRSQGWLCPEAATTH